MNEVTQILNAIDHGDSHAAKQLLPLVYDELRKLAAQRLASEKPGQTLQATALVHEAYLRLVGGNQAHQWDSRGHFFAAAAESMRRILVDAARRKSNLRSGGDRQRQDLLDGDLAIGPINDDLLDLDAALDKLAIHDGTAAELVKLHVFAGLTLDEIAQVQGLSSRTAKRTWSYARAWLGRELGSAGDRKTPVSQ